MVQLAECKTVRNDGLAEWVAVRQDVRRVEELLAVQAADGTVLVVRRNNALPEGLLMKPLLDLAGHVPAPGIRIGVVGWRSIQARELPVINAHRECEAPRVVTNNEDRP